MKINEGVLNDLPGELYTIDVDDKISDYCKYLVATIQAAENQKQMNTVGLVKLCKLKAAEKVNLTVDIDIQDRLISGQT